MTSGMTTRRRNGYRRNWAPRPVRVTCMVVLTAFAYAVLCSAAAMAGLLLAGIVGGGM